MEAEFAQYVLTAEKGSALPEGDPKAEGYKVGELTRATVIDTTLESDFRTQRDMFQYPVVNASPQIAPLLEPPPVPKVQAEAPGSKWIQSPLVFRPEEMIRQIN